MRGFFKGGRSIFKPKKIPNHIIVYLATFLIAVLAIVAALSTGWGFLLSPDKIVNGINVSGINLSKLNWQSASQKLKKLQTHMDNETITFSFLNKDKKVFLKELDVKIDISKTIDKAMILGHRGTFWEKWLVCKNAASRGYTIEPVIMINEDKVRQVVETLTEGVERKSQDAVLKINSNDQVEIIPEIIGLQVDRKNAFKQAAKIIKTRSASKVNIQLIYTKPDISAKDVQDMGISGLLSTFTTYFNANEENRVINIRLSIRAFDNLLVKPGETVSFNKVVGPRDTVFGYRSAKVIVNDKYTEGIGGGICQVSSTLYNSVLLANLEVVERVKHSLPVSYVPPDKDATVVYGAIDLKFKNNTGKYILIKSFVQGNSITFKIYGHKSA